MSNEKTWCVYMHRIPSNKAYIGVTSKKPTLRWSNGNGYKQHPYFWNAIQKYDWDNFEHIIFASNLAKGEALHMERMLIALFDTTNERYGYNCQVGGELGDPMYCWTEKMKQQSSERYSGVGNPMYGVHRFGEEGPMYGKKHTEESKAKMSKTKREMEITSRIPVICIETGVVYSSTYEANRQTGICQQNIAGCCRHEKHRKTAGGYHWEYVTEKEAC